MEHTGFPSLIDNGSVKGGSQADSHTRALSEKCRRLEDENHRLRALLTENGIDLPVGPAEAKPQKPSARLTLNTSQKIALFRSLFRGREDVYAQRWESPDGRSGYSPKTERDWKAYYAAKPGDRKRVDKETRKNIPLTDEAIHGHLAGIANRTLSKSVRRTVGIHGPQSAPWQAGAR